VHLAEGVVDPGVLEQREPLVGHVELDLVAVGLAVGVALELQAQARHQNRVANSVSSTSGRADSIRNCERRPSFSS
jgi:hypothetical protein